MANADIPALKEPSGLLRTDGKRPDGVTVTLLLWKPGKCVRWDVTVSDTALYVHETSQTPGAEAAAERKTNKYYSSLAQ